MSKHRQHRMHPRSLMNLELAHHAGENNSRAKLSEKQVQAARTVILMGGGCKAIADYLGVTVRAVQMIKTGVTWASVPWPSKPSLSGVAEIDAYQAGVAKAFSRAAKDAIEYG